MDFFSELENALTIFIFFFQLFLVIGIPILIFKIYQSLNSLNDKVDELIKVMKSK